MVSQLIISDTLFLNTTYGIAMSNGRVLIVTNSTLSTLPLVLQQRLQKLGLGLHWMTASKTVQLH